jgi:hypothetical protein
MLWMPALLKLYSLLIPCNLIFKNRLKTFKRRNLKSQRRSKESKIPLSVLFPKARMTQSTNTDIVTSITMVVGDISIVDRGLLHQEGKAIDIMSDIIVIGHMTEKIGGGDPIQKKVKKDNTETLRRTIILIAIGIRKRIKKIEKEG